MNNLPVIDLVFVIFIFVMVIHGYVRGFVEELFSWAALVLATWAAVLLYHTGGGFIRGKIMQNVKYVPEILAFIGIFLVVMILLKMVEYVLKDVVKGAKLLAGANKVLGLVFGFIEGLTLTALVIFVLSVQPVFDFSKILGDSIFAQILLPIIKIPLQLGKDVIKTALLFLPGFLA